MFCPKCGDKVDMDEIVCEHCGTPLDENVVGSVSATTPFPPRSISKLIPKRSERLVSCHKCGGENHRGETNCVYCGYLIIPATEIEEISEIDDKVFRQLSPKFHDDYFRIAAQLIVLKVLDRIDPYPCPTVIEMDDGSKVQCGQELYFYTDKCPRCLQPNKIGYNCKNKERGCNAISTIDMMRCPNPKCRATSMLSDIMSIIKGTSMSSDDTIQFIDENMQPTFPQFKMIRNTMRVMIDHKGLIMLKFDLESICERMAKIMKFLAIYLEAVTKRQGLASMKNVFQMSSLQNLSTSPPKRSDDLDALLQDRERNIQQGANGAAANNHQDDDDNDDHGGGGGNDDDGFDFTIGDHS